MHGACHQKAGTVFDLVDITNAVRRSTTGFNINRPQELFLEVTLEENRLLH